MSDSAPPWRPQVRVQVDRKVLRDGVFNQLVEMLLGDRLTPGAGLNIDGLARELGVSPTPVREALVQLEHTGLVSRVALRGYRVSAPLTPDEIGQVFARVDDRGRAAYPGLALVVISGARPVRCGA